jgi:hypothetical protein
MELRGPPEAAQATVVAVCPEHAVAHSGPMPFCIANGHRISSNAVGVAYVKYDKASSAALAIENLHEVTLNDGAGPRLKVLLADSPHTRCDSYTCTSLGDLWGRFSAASEAAQLVVTCVPRLHDSAPRRQPSGSCTNGSPASHPPTAVYRIMQGTLWNPEKAVR